MSDPLALHEFAAHILTSIGSLAPVAAVGLVVILLVWGWAHS